MRPLMIRRCAVVTVALSVVHILDILYLGRCSHSWCGSLVLQPGQPVLASGCVWSCSFCVLRARSPVRLSLGTTCCFICVSCFSSHVRGDEGVLHNSPISSLARSKAGRAVACTHSSCLQHRQLSSQQVSQSGRTGRAGSRAARCLRPEGPQGGSKQCASSSLGRSCGPRASRSLVLQSFAYYHILSSQ
jgi:hypothetical protein